MLYRSIQSLKNYVIVSSTELYLEVYTRSNAQWILSTASKKDEKIELSAIKLHLPLADVYEQIEAF